MTSADRDKVKYIKTYQLTGHTHHDGSLMDSNRGRNVIIMWDYWLVVPPISSCITREVTT
jgi:hypothetical protein